LEIVICDLELVIYLVRGGFFYIFVTSIILIMAKILCLETSTEVCSVAIVDKGLVIDFREDISGQNHSRLLTVFILDLLKSNQLTASDFDAVAVSEGPGSYTGLRIGVSAAKGICYGAGIPLIAINPLKAMASYVVETGTLNGLSLLSTDLLAPMIDARRMEVFTSIYDLKLNEINPVNALVVETNSFDQLPSGSRIVLFGNGSAKCKPILNSSRFIYIDEVIASSRNMAILANLKYENNDFVDVAYFEPFYLKDFVATVPKNNVLKTH
jgi:tRNA threonylcarbamoyladenosine biosynthesis protein TsaB